MVSTATRYWHTLRWLRPVQLYWRLWFRVYRPRPDTRAAPMVRASSAAWVACRRAPRQTGPSTFRFIGEERTLDARADWNRADWPKLWLYNLHYFDDLVADGAASRRAWHRDLIDRWIRDNPPASGNGWEPYPTSLRLVNWMKYLLAGGVAVEGMVHSMAVQTRHLRRRLEHHLLGNHLWANLKALVFAGTFFQGEEADRWRHDGLRLLRRELREQVLPDGGHFERSPMYHAIVLEDLIDLIQLDRIHPGVLPHQDVRAWQEAAGRMLDWLQVMSHPDGEIALFNDAAIGIAPKLGDLAGFASATGLAWQPQRLDACTRLEPSGYLRIESARAVLIMDVGPVGPDYLPGHAHADTLSLELSVDGRRVLVNGGTSTYAPGPQRLAERGTAMHNTVTVDGADSSEVWSSFRVARRARVDGVSVVESAEGVRVSARHDGFRRLPGRVMHAREVCLSGDRLEVVDRLDGSHDEARAYFRFAPGFSEPTEGGPVGRVSDQGGDVDWTTDGAVRVERGQWHPRFGAAEPCVVLVAPVLGGWRRVAFSW